MSLRERVVRELERLPDNDLQQVAEYLAFLKYRSAGKRRQPATASSLADLYARFQEEDRSLAECGMAEYGDALAREDSA